jgi:phosphatidylserine/phosphatidylglycerophosphate/cardiolipin synthase-like enzyme
MANILMFRFRRLAVFCACLFVGLPTAAQTQRVDLLLHNGKVVTVDDRFSIHQAIAVLDGKVVEVGDERLVKKYQADRVIDLRGRLLMPGFNDTHIHISGDSLRHIELAGTRSIEDLKNKVRAKAKDNLSFAKTPQDPESRPGNNVTGGSACYSFQTHFEFWRGTGRAKAPGSRQSRTTAQRGPRRQSGSGLSRKKGASLWETKLSQVRSNDGADGLGISMIRTSHLASLTFLHVSYHDI